jgi:predicted peptidase
MKHFLKIIIIIIIFYGGHMSAENLPQTRGIHKQSLALSNGQTLHYTLYIPKSYPSQKEVPFIMALHYGGTVTPWYGEGYLSILVKPALRRLNAIIAAPDCPTPNGWDNPTAEAAVIALMNHIKQHYKIDETKTLLTGFSMGGIGTWYMAARHPQLFSAFIPVSAVAGPGIIEKIKDIPIYVIHSKADEVFPVKQVEKMVQTLKTRGVSVQLKTLRGISHYQTQAFSGALRKTIPWIKEIWGETENK